MNARPLGAVAVECRTLRTGCPPHEAGSGIQTGDVREDTSRIAAESARFTITVGEFGSGCPPKRRICELLNGDSACQAKAGPWDVDAFEEELTSSHGGD